jgi:hypothetical protein
VPVAFPLPGMLTLPSNDEEPQVNLHHPDFDDRNLVAPGEESEHG